MLYLIVPNRFHGYDISRYSDNKGLIFFSIDNLLKDSSVESPTDILKKRYARGEITKEEFDRLKKELEKQPEG